MIHPIYAPNGSVQVRFMVVQVKEKDYDEWYAHHPFYVVVKREGTIRHPIYYLLTKISDYREFVENYLAKNGSFKCTKCKDSAVWHDEDSRWHYCDCDFGKLVQKRDIWK